MTDTIQVLKKGSSIPVATKEGKPVNSVYLGMGWTISKNGGDNYDLDFSMALAGADKKIHDDKHLIYYDSAHRQFKVGTEVVVQHSDDNLTGSTGQTDDEWGTIKLDKIPAEIQHIFVFVNMYEAADRKQHFGDVDKAYFKVVDADSNTTLAQYELEKEFDNHTGVMVADIHRVGAVWEAAILGQAVDGSIDEILKSYGLE